jgi:hypothetical protein
MTDSDLVRRFPAIGARVVVRSAELGGDVANAWSVLIAAVGEAEARRLVAAARAAREDGAETFLHPFRPSADEPSVCAECGAWVGDSEHAAEYYKPSIDFGTAPGSVERRASVRAAMGARLDGDR